MPELPEVETIKNVLSKIVIGNTIKSIDIYRKGTIEGDSDLFASELVNETFLSMSRIGKYLIFHLTNDKVIVSHLRMEGKYYEYDENDSDSKYAKVVFHLSNGKKLCYDDSRCFGILKLSNEQEYKNLEMISKLGPEPFDVKDVKGILKQVSKIKKPIKTTLLEQTIITGLGNIYVDETLYACHIHPLTPACLITKEEWELIIKNSIEILNIAIKMGGSTIKSYHPGKDIDGNFQTRIKIYGKEGETCPTCGHDFRFIKVGGRGTTFCPVCQRKKGQPHNIGLTGKIASGKSSALSFYKDLGADIISSDEIVKKLYQTKEVASLIEKTLNIKFNNEFVDKDLLRNHLITNPKDKRKLEKIIHPLVEKEIVRFLNESTNPIRVCEVPLLFEAKLDHYFDSIVVIDIDEKTQLERLNKREGNKAVLLEEINKTNKIDQNKNKATYIIRNNKGLNELKNEIKKTLNEVKDLI
jgi:formamidopyrimidine-DNA glycosylase